jgi:hypothetical protein
MSHLVAIKTEVKDVAALKAACAEMGLVFKEGQRTYKWWGESMGDYPLPEGVTKAELGTCAHAIGVPGATWEIGLMENKKTGGYRIMFDFYGHEGQKLDAAIGRGGEKLLQLYGVHKAQIEAKKRGLLFTRKQVGSKIQCTVSGM